MSWQVIWELVVGFVSSAVEKSLAVGGGMTHVEIKQGWVQIQVNETVHRNETNRKMLWSKGFFRFKFNTLVKQLLALKTTHFCAWRYFYSTTNGV